MIRAAILFVLLFGVWLALSGHFTPLLMTFGALSSAGIVLMALRMRILDEEGLPLGMAARFVAYIPWLILETIRSNIAVAKVILAPSLPISPVLFRFRARPKTDLGRFLFANSITFTPGTTTCDIDGEEFLVYAITRDAAGSVEEGEMVRRVCRVEGTQ
jgi:multicomponent Na+:H+ antiporter subunit E